MAQPAARSICPAVLQLIAMLGVLGLLSAGSLISPAYPQAAANEALPAAGPLEEKIEGNDNAPITVVEYVSLTCYCCQKFHNAVYPTLKSQFIDTGKVRFIIREFPLDSLGAAGFMLARCAANDKYFPFIDALFRRSSEWIVRQPVEPLSSIAKGFGLSKQDAEACLSDRKILDGVQAVRDRAEGKIDHIPTLFINGQKLEDSTNWDSPTLKELAKVLEQYKGFGCGVTPESIPKDARGFLDWCEKKGLSTRDVNGNTCGFELWTTLHFGFDERGGCPALAKRIKETKTEDVDTRLVIPVLQWIRNHPQHQANSAEDAMVAALTELYRCPKVPYTRKRPQ
jgi:protein-disulfide isomerase